MIVSSNQALFRRVLDPMFDDGFCRIEDVPCDKDEEFPERRRTGPMCGLNGMEYVKLSPCFHGSLGTELFGSLLWELGFSLTRNFSWNIILIYL
jgi:hypothetical protein